MNGAARQRARDRARRTLSCSTACLRLRPRQLFVLGSSPGQLRQLLFRRRRVIRHRRHYPSGMDHSSLNGAARQRSCALRDCVRIDQDKQSALRDGVHRSKPVWLRSSALRSMDDKDDGRARPRPEGRGRSCSMARQSRPRHRAAVRSAGVSAHAGYDHSRGTRGERIASMATASLLRPRKAAAKRIRRRPTTADGSMP